MRRSKWLGKGGTSKADEKNERLSEYDSDRGSENREMLWTLHVNGPHYPSTIATFSFKLSSLDFGFNHYVLLSSAH